MKARAFEYKGFTFEPVGNLMGNWVAKSSQTTWAYFLEINGYSHENFYKEAKKNHASCDVFKVNGKLYIPCSKCFLGIIENAKIKSCEEYESWYH